jgi:hypothetical protein
MTKQYGTVTHTFRSIAAVSRRVVSVLLHTLRHILLKSIRFEHEVDCKTMMLRKMSYNMSDENKSKVKN